MTFEILHTYFTPLSHLFDVATFMLRTFVKTVTYGTLYEILYSLTSTVLYVLYTVMYEYL